MGEREEFAETCEALPEGVHWGDELTVGIATAIWRTAQKAILLQIAHPATLDRDAIIKQCAAIAERTYVANAFRFELGAEAAHAIRSLKTTPTAASREES